MSLKEYFSNQGISLDDILNKIAVESILSLVNVDERIQAKMVLGSCNENDIIIFDCSFSSFEFTDEHFERNLGFIIRMSVNLTDVVKDFVAGGKASQIVEMYPYKKQI
ncbi:hypothetical protein [Chryseobacterium sp. SL1]|uniref:hypothetical protein n=1 Tax=Chryseobacterium sp. SL1 TaxID=2995159 RepID=UPI0022758178|nr:hypothetical protein [Chryseobacterium sp. SL1]MCY1660213.1 hypothetical protein [Chryseobacterium sp. SL1]